MDQNGTKSFTIVLKTRQRRLYDPASKFSKVVLFTQLRLTGFLQPTPWWEGARSLVGAGAPTARLNSLPAERSVDGDLHRGT